MRTATLALSLLALVSTASAANAQVRPHESVRVDIRVPAVAPHPRDSGEYLYVATARRVGGGERSRRCDRAASSDLHSVPAPQRRARRLVFRLHPQARPFCRGRWRGSVTRIRNAGERVVHRFEFRVAGRSPALGLRPRQGRRNTPFVLRYWALGSDETRDPDLIQLYGPPRTSCSGLLAEGSSGESAGLQTISFAPYRDPGFADVGVQPRRLRSWCPGVYRVHLLEDCGEGCREVTRRYAFRVLGG